MKFTLYILLIAQLALASCTSKTTPFDPQPERARRLVIVNTEQGRLAGYENDSGLDVFLGIPYAEPPVSGLRFAPPRPVNPWSHVQPAYLFGPTCPQPLDPIESASLLHQDEDCLTLNVWTPGIDGKRRPVLVWIHGGGFVQGGSGDPLYEGSNLCKQGDLVVVSLNYRLGPLGFLALDEFGGEYAGSGNLALLDQMAALRWIKDNISQFGGDPENVTIMGESAGSVSVMLLMLSPQARGLFQKAIAESGTFNLTRSREQAVHLTRRFMEIAGVKDVEGLRSLSAKRMVEVETSLLEEAGMEADMAFAPVRDGVVVPADPMKALAEGAASGIPLMHGTTSDEYRYWLLYFSPLKYLPLRMFLAMAPGVAGRLGPNRDTVLANYRDTPGNPVFALVTDMAFRVPHMRVADIQSRHAPVWTYRFDWPSGASKDLGACHTIELPFVFKTFGAPRCRMTVGANPPMALCGAMMDAWIGFARSGDPNSAGQPSWPVWNRERRATMVFKAQSVVRDDPDKPVRMLYQRMLEGAEYAD